MRSENHLALWAALTALFGSLATINVAALLGEDDAPLAQFVISLVTAAIVAGGVYAKQRWDDAKRAREEREADGTRRPVP